MTTPKIQNSYLESGGGSGGGDATTEAVSYYADGTSGSDSNDGLTALTPKKTLQAVFDLIPFHVRHNVDVNLEGTFSSEVAVLNKNVSEGVYLNVDGGSDVTTSSGPHTVNSNGSSYIYTSDTITDYVWQGYWLKMTNGFRDNYIRNIRLNSSNYFYFNKYLTGTLTGNTFVICKPTTNLASGSIIKISCSGPGTVVAQRFHLNTNTRLWAINSSAEVVFTCLTSTNESNGAHYDVDNCNKVVFHSNLYSNGSFTDTTGAVGVSDFSSTTYDSVTIKHTKDVTIKNMCVAKVLIDSCGLNLVNDGCNFFNRVNIVNTKSIGGSDVTEPHSFEYTSDTGGIQFSNGVTNTNGLYIVNSNLGIKCVSASSSNGAGIVMDNSTVRFESSQVAGSSNSGAGVYLHSGSVLLLKQDGGLPTLTGTAGEISINNSTQKTTWTLVYGGTPFEETTEMVIGKRFS